MGPGEADQIVHHRFGKVAHVAIGDDRSGAMALAQPRLVGTQDERHMSELWQRTAQSLVEMNLPRRVGQVVVAADDMADRHVDVVDDDAEIIRRRAVGAGDDEIVELAVFEDDIALDQIFDHRRALARRAEADDIGLVGRQRGNHAFRRPASAVIGRFAFFFHRRLAFGVELRGAASAGIGFAHGQQFLNLLSVKRVALALIKRPFVIIEFEPFHGVKNRLDRLGGRPFAVGVLDAQDKFAAMMTREEKIKQRGARAADMQIAGRAGRESGSDLCHCVKLTGG